MLTIKHYPHGRDPARWVVAGLVVLALTGIGAMHAHTLMLRRGLDLLPALAQAGSMVLLAALPIGYLVYRFWFAAPRPLLKGAVVTDPVHESGLDEDEWFKHYTIGWRAGHAGWGLYHGHTRIDDDRT